MEKDLTITIGQKVLIKNSELKIQKEKYGLIGKNGSGKTSLLNYIYEKYKKDIDMFIVNQELNFENKSIYDIVSDANFKKVKILDKIKTLESHIETDMTAFEKYTKLNTKLSQLNVNQDEMMIRRILYGLGFDNELQSKPFQFFSGGWRMRVAIARGLYIQPQLLILDEPTNHLDINAVIWLTSYLKDWKKSLIIVSHDKYFLNKICNKMIHIENYKLNYYNGNYDTFEKTYLQKYNEMENNWNRIQRRVKEMKNKSTKKEIVDEFIKNNIHLKPIEPYRVKVEFHMGEPLRHDCIVSCQNVSAGYSENLFESLDLNIDMGDKIVIVGKNGIGKSTFFKLLLNELTFTGDLKINPNVQIGYYNQHLTDILPLDKTPIDYLVQANKALDIFKSRKYLGSIGLEGDIHTRKINTLSGGQKARVVLALINSLHPHLLLLDEPTNHLDIETIEALIHAVNQFKGAVVMITHHIDIIEKTNAKILVLKDKTLEELDFDDYYQDVLDEIK